MASLTRPPIGLDPWTDKLPSEVIMKTHPVLIVMALLLAAPTAYSQPTEDVRTKLDELKYEPTVRDVQEAALGYFRVNQRQIESMRNRARSKAIAPVVEISGGFSKSELDDISTNAAEGFNTLDDPWVTRGSGGIGWNVRGKMSFNLPRLVFNPEELDVASLAGLVEGILKESTRLYFMRRRLQVDMILKPPTDQATLISKQLRIEELTGLLDAMTGGWFQRSLDQLYGRAPAVRRPDRVRQTAGSSPRPTLSPPPQLPMPPRASTLSIPSLNSTR
jgi:hypothetical protein